MTTPLAAELGRLAAPASRTPFDDVRLSLVDALVAANTANRMGQDAWEEAFGAAVRSLRLRVLAEGETAVRAAAQLARYPARRMASVLPSSEDADVLLQRLLAEGMPLERFEGFADDPVTRRARAAAMETAWDGAVRVATAEMARWRAVAAELATWRRPTTTLWVLSVATLLIALLLASWLSGFVPAPAWFRPVNDLWWRLWP